MIRFGVGDPDRGGMARATIHAREDRGVGYRTHDRVGLAGVVAGGAQLARDERVVEVGWCKSQRGMAIAASIECCRGMVGGLSICLGLGLAGENASADRHNTIVAGHTSCSSNHRIGMAENGQWLFETTQGWGNRMTCSAIVRREQMGDRLWLSEGDATIVAGHAGQSLDHAVRVLEICRRDGCPSVGRLVA